MGVEVPVAANDCNVFLESIILPSGKVNARKGIRLIPLLVFDVTEERVGVDDDDVMVWIDASFTFRATASS